MAAALLERERSRRGAPGSVTSAGFLTADQPAQPHALTVMADEGLDLGEHRSRVVDADLLAGTDLVLGMTREHVREAVVLRPEHFPRTFTLKELTRRAEDVGPVGAGGLDPWLEAIGEERQAVQLMGSHRADDIADPMGLSLRAFRKCAAEIDEHVGRLADLLWPAPAP